MTVEPADAADAAEDAPGAVSGGATVPPDARRTDPGHLDEDPEALEDPVHRGDAQHQHEAREHPPGRAG